MKRKEGELIVTFTLDRAAHKKIKKMAKENERTLGAQLRWLVYQSLNGKNSE